MALLLAESLLEREGFDAHDQVQRYARWQREGYGSATGQCVGHLGQRGAGAARRRSTSASRFAGSHDPGAARQGSAVARCARWSCTSSPMPPAAVAKAAEAARLTAQAPMVLDCVRLLAAMLHLALSGPRQGARCCTRRANCGSRASTRPEVLAIYEGSYAHRMPPEITGGGGILQALEAALWAFHRSETFREGALLAANLGRDSDVVAAAYGQIGRRLSRCECDSGNLA